MIRLSMLFSAASALVFIIAGCARLEQACIAMSAAAPVSPPLKSGFSFSDGSAVSGNDILSSAMPSFIPAVREVTANEIATTLIFSVDRQGNVMSGIDVTKSSGYPEGDKNVINTFSRWKFKSAPGIEARNGTITFRMVRP